MKISKNKVVTIEYHIKSIKAHGRSVAPEEGKATYLHGNYEGILPAVEFALEGLQQGDEINLELEPKEHFGEYNEELVRVEDISLMPPNIKVGVVLEGHNPVTGQVVLFHITDINGDKVTVNANHPFAGTTIQFSAKVLDVRDATAEEISHGHVHGEGGHHH